MVIGNRKRLKIKSIESGPIDSPTIDFTVSDPIDFRAFFKNKLIQIPLSKIKAFQARVIARGKASLSNIHS